MLFRPDICFKEDLPQLHFMNIHVLGFYSITIICAGIVSELLHSATWQAVKGILILMTSGGTDY